MELYGLVGKTLKHSFSGDYFTRKFEKHHISAQYQLFELDPLPNLHQFAAENPSLKGFNLTIPYKRNAYIQMDDLSQKAVLTGSVNVVKVFRRKGTVLLKGYNTDVIGFEQSLKPLVKGKKLLRALILGSGGSAHSVACVLRKFGIYFYFVTRQPKKLEMMGYSWITPEIMKEFKLIVNTTPVGMFPNTGEAPDIPYHLLTREHILFDLIYNPQETLFLKKGKAQGATVKNGWDMLKVQAEASWKIWRKR
jgi:shikimate dehydrogenase